MSEGPDPITIPLHDDLLAELDQECDAVDLRRSEYIRSILRDREVAEQIATSEIKSRQLQKLKEYCLIG
jgi:metal-responsive CopG/Arc/MetJ family transcriptional regulator